MLQQDMDIMRREIIALIDKLGGLLTTDDKKDKVVFFINNYDQILQVFEENNVMSREVQHFEDLLMQQRELFAEEQIRLFFPKLIAFVVKSEELINVDLANAKKVILADESTVESLVKEFASGWKT